MRFGVCAFGVVAALQKGIDAATAAKFYYDDQSDWPSVGEADNECSGTNGSGEGQSPIDITTTETCSSIDETYKFFEGSCTLTDYKFSINDHGIKASIQDSCRVKPKMIMPGNTKEYEVLQFHIHTGCEHFFDGKGCDAELHIVHIAKEEETSTARESELPDLAVVGMMIFGGDTVNDGADPLIDSWSAVQCGDDCDAGLASQYVGQSFTPYSMIPSGTPFYKYFGGLTTPPCWEAVNWNVAELPIKISWRQLLKISNLINKFSGYRDENDQCVADATVADAAGLTSREVQDLNGRVVEKVCTKASFISDLAETPEESKAASSSAARLAMGASSAVLVVLTFVQFLF